MAVSSDGLLSLRVAPRAWPPRRGNVARAPSGESGTRRVPLPLPPHIAASAKTYIKHVYKSYMPYITSGRAGKNKNGGKERERTFWLARIKVTQSAQLFTDPSKSASHFSSDFARSRSGDDNDLGGNANTCKHALRSEPSPGFRPESPWDHVLPRGLAFWCCGRWRRKWNTNSPCMVFRLIRIVVLLWLLESDQLAVRPLCYCTLPL